ncbi:hypothetical protein EZV73_24725 [Acidaminobacter sp. JC074]|uniref:nucleoside-triphosphatase n=1 Tax=Acidaminobacter sp. JC074 TaxID=2530199 RepID=UPI001F0CEAED|nr:nucleoside-triphosphatase [Acidaminobacter sp. JC074]MCH4890807.1 hypothetical protein [Acidaminobacter sp. JC074]
MNILLTGPIQIGKSTILRKVITHLKLQVTGFYTGPFTINNEVIGYKMYDYNKLTEPFIIGLKDTPVSCKPYTEMFETKGLEILEKKPKDAYLLDELGFLERHAHTYQKKIHEILDGDVLVLGVLKDKHNDFLDSIRNRDDVTIIRVSKSNRDYLAFEIIRLIESM